MITRNELLATIDHSILKPQSTVDQIRQELEYAAAVKPKSVCIVPRYLGLAVAVLNGTGVACGTVVGFPHGSTYTSVKVFEASQALADGATEIDMVAAIGALRSGDYVDVRKDIEAVVGAVRANALVKVIVETAYLTDEEIVKAATIASDAGAAFVKTSTGFASAGATPQGVALLRRGAGPGVKVKAAGGLKTLGECLQVLDAGADRIGISRTRSILAELEDAN